MRASVQGWSPSWDFYITRLRNLSTDRWVTIMLRHLNRSDEADQAVEKAWDAASEVAVADPVADYEVPEPIFSAALEEAGEVAETAAELGAFRRDRVDAVTLARSAAESFVMQMPVDRDALRGYVADLASLAASALVVRGYTVATTIRSILRRSHVPPAGRRSELTWKQFLAAHAETLAGSESRAARISPHSLMEFRPRRFALAQAGRHARVGQV